MRRVDPRTVVEEEDRRNRRELFRKNLALTAARTRRRVGLAERNADALKNRAEKTTKMLNSLVLRMSDQVKQSEEVTAALVHSSATLKETHSNILSISATIRSGGKLISKYARRETTDKILIVLALILYCGVVFYILRKRLPFFGYLTLWPLL